jgi:Rod binding domain-containing protein
MTIDNSSALMALNKSQTDKVSNTNTKDDAKLKKQTDAFEAILVKQMLDEAVKIDSPLFPKSAGSDIYKSMYTDAISQSVAGGFGFSKMLFDFLKERG